AGKPQGMDGGEVEKYYRDGRIKEIAQYCESDVINTYRVWLRYELFRGKLTTQSYEASEANLQKFLEARTTQRHKSSKRSTGRFRRQSANAQNPSGSATGYSAPAGSVIPLRKH